MSKKILKKIEKGLLTAEQGYDLLYRPKTRPARYISLRTNIQEQKWVSSLINLLFFFPIPIVLGERLIWKEAKKKGMDIDYPTFKSLIATSGGTAINVISEEAKIQISIF
ncbi:MAG TPA: hypothetical protein DD618_04505 [Acholeplasmatales bacterium]|nr:hypothetical protein [Acholeplasmatales bacterium]